MAHMLEHICFLGSECRTRLQSSGLGMTSNACTDFNHTVYHLSMNKEDLAKGLEALADIGFSPAFRPERVEKERSAVLSEAQMVNDCTYRMQTQFLGAVHADNLIHARFPIGLESQISRWSIDELRAFHRRWYVPENATLYVVGDIDEEGSVAEVESAFSSFPKAGLAAADPWEFDATSLYRPTLQGRPSLLHDYVKADSDTTDEVPGLQSWNNDLKVSVATNELMQGMQVSWAAKQPLVAAGTSEDLAPWLCRRLVTEAVKLRLSARWRSGSIPCNLHSYDSNREGVTLTTLSVRAEPARWQDTCEEVLQEVLAISRHGLAQEELELAKRMYLDRVAESASAQPWALMGSLYGHEPAGTSREVADALIASTPCGFLLTDAASFSTALRTASEKIDLEWLNTTTKSMLGHFGPGGDPRGVVVVSCPATVADLTGQKVPFTNPEASEVDTVLRNVKELDAEDVASRVVSAPVNMAPAVGAEIPQLLERQAPTSSKDVATLRLANGLLVRLLVMPAGSSPARGGMRLTVPGGRASDAREGRPGASEAMLMALDACGVGKWSQEETQIYRVLNSVQSELRAGTDALELNVHFTPSPSSSRAALEWLHWVLLDPKLDLQGFTDAQLRMKGNTQLRDKTLHERAKQELLENMYPSQPWLAETPMQSINQLTLGQAKRAAQSQLGSFSSLELDIAVMVSSRTGGDGGGLMHEEEFEDAAQDNAADVEQEDEVVAEVRRNLENEVCRCLSSLPAGPGTQTQRPAPSASTRGCERRVHMLDNEARALVLIGGSAPGYWGRGDETWQRTAKFKSFSWGSRATHPLYPARVTEFMVECLNTRLLGRLRDQLSLTYNCDMELFMFEGFDAGHFICKVFTFPETQQRAAQAAVEVLKSPEWLPFTDREVEASKKVMAYREGKALREDRDYWLGRVRPLQDANGNRLLPGDRFEEEAKLLESFTADDVQHAWRALGGLDDPWVVMATSGPPQVAQVLTPGPVVPRSAVPEAVAAAEAAAPPRPAGGGQIFLD
eukprot:TRINITY_DN6162_c0_g2_i1.p1 TRINITY_DN6162_c0_g2~~TRINITY_DN6162_c0_g2_i1.p1  ORF type:complete len:1173 (+),score=264.06 TRINITY_DN6162_c0_g2_i1:464-3520(+)